MIGSMEHTRPFSNRQGFGILGAKRWNLPVNDSWIQGGIDRSSVFMLASPRTRRYLWDAAKGRWRVYAREIRQLRSAGYKRVGDYLIPLNLQ